MEQVEVEKMSWWVRLALLGGALLFALSVFVLYYQFWMTPETNCGIVVLGTNALSDAKVVVERVTADPSDELRLSALIERDNAYEARFFLPSGTYKMSVVNAHGQIILNEPAEFVPPDRRLILDLRQRFPATRPASTTN